MSDRRERVRHHCTVGACALLLSPLSLAASAEQYLGRLFSTADQRARLDAMRAGFGHGAVASTRGGDASESRSSGSVVDRLRIEGVVLGGDGRGLVWVNGEPVSSDGGVTRDGLVIVASRAQGVRVVITFPRGGEAELRPGQTFDVARGNVLETYEVTEARRRRR